MNITHKLYKTSMLVMLAGISVSSFATPPTCPQLAAYGNTSGSTSIIAALEANPGLLTAITPAYIDSCLSQCTQPPTTTGYPAGYTVANSVSDATNATQCNSGLSTLAYAVNYVNTLQAYTPNGYTASPNSSSSSAAPPTPAPSLPLPTPPQDNNTSQAPGYVPTPQLSNNNSNNANNTNSNNNNISNNTRSYIRWY